MKYLTIIIFTILVVSNIAGQEKKKVEAIFINTPLTIDGILDEPIYSKASPAKDFVQLQPLNGKPSYQPTEVYFFYDQTAIYVGALLHDSKPDSIFNFLTERDNIGMSDYFGVYLDPYNQGQLAYGFFITPAGVQVDIKAIKGDGDNEDSNWNAVWESKTKITKDGWIVEMKIPFSTLRFPDTKESSWGLNMFRNIRRYNSNNSWNLVDRKISGFIHQEGELTGIKNVKTPVRLSLSPYLATYFEPNNNSNTSKLLYKGGLDLKYGINDAFTLDMMLIPDFGQIQSDDQKLNLSPFELYYDEKRQFFTEGTELFQRGNIFYSRRIGASPKFSADNKVGDNETITYSPSETQLVNATKISGRTDNGWGLGILNAMSLPSNAVITNSITDISRNILVQPFTNYNVAVIDKSLKNNSYVSIINTNVSMLNNPFHANVTATEFQLRDNSKTYVLKGKGGISNRGDTINETGYFGSLGIERNKGNFQCGMVEYLYSDKYNPNDLGYIQRNNQVNTEAWLYYQKIEPFWIIRECNGDVFGTYYRVYNPSTFFDQEFGYDASMLFKNNYRLSSSGKYSTNQFDYYEPRVTGRFYQNPQSLFVMFNLNTDQRKSLNFSLQYKYTTQPSISHYIHETSLYTNLRIGQRFNVDYEIDLNNSRNERGFVDLSENKDSIVFAKRNVYTLVNTLSTSYILNNTTSLKLRVRHYWSGVENEKFFLLQTTGLLIDNTSYSENKDQNYNAFTVDMILRWIFAPGSELSLAWKTASFSNGDIVDYNYFSNFKNSWLNQTNSLSLKVLYYIDVNSFKKKKT